MDVPASVSAGSSETLGQTGAKTGGDIVSLTSGVSLAAGAVEAGGVQVNIRGLNGARGAENSVAIVVDGIQRSSKAALIPNQKSEERRVGTECVRTFRFRWSQYH